MKSDNIYHESIVYISQNQVEITKKKNWLCITLPMYQKKPNTYISSLYTITHIIHFSLHI